MMPLPIAAIVIETTMLAIEKGETAACPFIAKSLILMDPRRFRRGCLGRRSIAYRMGHSLSRKRHHL
jgi:hypothetical protein